MLFSMCRRIISNSEFCPTVSAAQRIFTTAPCSTCLRPWKYQVQVFRTYVDCIFECACAQAHRWMYDSADWFYFPQTHGYVDHRLRHTTAPNKNRNRRESHGCGGRAKIIVVQKYVCVRTFFTHAPTQLHEHRANITPYTPYPVLA